jgi:hypothetical protein
MKKIVTLVSAVLLTASVWAQAPQKFSYQAVIRNASNTLVVNRKVGIRISLIQASANDVVVYSERHEPATNTNGLVSIEIGGGLVLTGDFTKIDWSNGPFYVKTETDLTGGKDYTILVESQLLSVPYALYSLNGQVGPAGKDGSTGPQGPIGLTGQTGKDGATGPQGPIGPQGPAGKDGATGPQGLIGLTGSAGKDGATGPQGPAGFGGANLSYPDGFDSISPVIKSNYTVPNGYNLYITYAANNNNSIYIDGKVLTFQTSLHNPIIASPGQNVSSSNTFYGFIVPAHIEAITQKIEPNESYTIPSGKTFYLLNIYKENVTINGNYFLESSIGYMRDGLWMPVLLPSGTIITAGSYLPVTINGYFK